MLLTTHYMFEADSLCDRIAVIAKGEIVAQGTPQELRGRASTPSGVVEVEVFGIDEASVAPRARSSQGVRAAVVEEQEQRAAADRPDDAPATRADARRSSPQLNGTARSAASPSREPTLEDAYVQLVTAA